MAKRGKRRGQDRLKPIDEKHVPKALRTSTYIDKRNLKRFQDFTEPSPRGIKRRSRFLKDIEAILGVKLW